MEKVKKTKQTNNVNIIKSLKVPPFSGKASERTEHSPADKTCCI